MISVVVFNDLNEIKLKDNEKYLLVKEGIRIKRDVFIALDKFLDKWELGLVYEDYSRVVKDIISENDRELINEFLPDLRVPFYRDDIFFLRICKNIEEFVRIYKERLAYYEDSKLAIIEALWKTKPLYITLPCEILE